MFTRNEYNLIDNSLSTACESGMWHTEHFTDEFVRLQKRGSGISFREGCTFMVEYGMVYKMEYKKQFSHHL